MARDPREFLPLKADALLILLAVDGEPRHGYAIIKEVERRTNGATLLQTGALYRELKYFLTARLIEETATPVGAPDDDPRRRYYRTTRLGREVMDAETERMAALVRTLRTHRARNTSKNPRLA